MHRHALIKIIDFEHDHVTVSLERPEVVLFVRVVRVAKVVEHRSHVATFETARLRRGQTFDPLSHV